MLGVGFLEVCELKLYGEEEEGVMLFHMQVPKNDSEGVRQPVEEVVELVEVDHIVDWVSFFGVLEHGMGAQPKLRIM